MEQCLVRVVSVYRILLLERKKLTVRSCVGQLVVYFPTNVVSDPITEREDFTIPQKEQTSLRRGPVRVSEAFGYLPSAIGDAAGGGDEYQETDEALQMATARSVQSVSCSNLLESSDAELTYAVRFVRQQAGAGGDCPSWSGL